MKNATELLQDFFEASWRDPKEMVSLFTADGGLELPYLTDFGYPERFAGAEGIIGFTEFLHDTFPGLHLENLKILIETPDQVFAEYEFTAVSTKTGRKVHQLFFARLVAENGKIKLVREGMNSAEVARAVFKQGYRNYRRGQTTKGRDCLANHENTAPRTRSCSHASRRSHETIQESDRDRHGRCPRTGRQPCAGLRMSPSLRSDGHCDQEQRAHTDDEWHARKDEFAHRAPGMDGGIEVGCREVDGECRKRQHREC